MGLTSCQTALSRIIWSWRRGSNPRPADYKSAALPTELHQQMGKTHFPLSSTLQCRSNVSCIYFSASISFLYYTIYYPFCLYMKFILLKSRAISRPAHILTSKYRICVSGHRVTVGIAFEHFETCLMKQFYRN